MGVRLRRIHDWPHPQVAKNSPPTLTRSGWRDAFSVDRLAVRIADAKSRAPNDARGRQVPQGLWIRVGGWTSDRAHPRILPEALRHDARRCFGDSADRRTKPAASASVLARSACTGVDSGAGVVTRFGGAGSSARLGAAPARARANPARRGTSLECPLQSRHPTLRARGHGWWHLRLDVTRHHHYRAGAVSTRTNDHGLSPAWPTRSRTGLVGCDP